MQRQWSNILSGQGSRQQRVVFDIVAENKELCLFKRTMQVNFMGLAAIVKTTVYKTKRYVPQRLRMMTL